MFVFFKSLVFVLVSFPIYVNVVHLFFCVVLVAVFLLFYSSVYICMWWIIVIL
jgi:hypothetical protein